MILERTARSNTNSKPEKEYCNDHYVIVVDTISYMNCVNYMSNIDFAFNQTD